MSDNFQGLYMSEMKLEVLGPMILVSVNWNKVIFRVLEFGVKWRHFLVHAL